MELTKDGRTPWSVINPIQQEFARDLTERELDCLAWHEEFLWLSADTIRKLYSKEFGRVGLKNLVRAGYLKRVGMQDRIVRDQVRSTSARQRVRVFENRVASSYVTGLTNKGAALLGKNKRDRDWDERNREIKPASLPHPLNVATVAVEWINVERNYEHLDLSRFPRGSIGLKIPRRSRSLVPDLVMRCNEPGFDPGIDFIEVDRGTEPNLRSSNSDLESLAKKDLLYLAYCRSGQLEKDFGAKASRVLKIVEGGESKKQNVARTSLAVCNGIGGDRFLVTTMIELEQFGPLAPIWINAHGDPRSIVSLPL